MIPSKVDHTTSIESQLLVTLKANLMSDLTEIIRLSLNPARGQAVDFPVTVLVHYWPPVGPIIKGLIHNESIDQLIQSHALISFGAREKPANRGRGIPQPAPIALLDIGVYSQVRYVPSKECYDRPQMRLCLEKLSG